MVNTRQRRLAPNSPGPDKRDPAEILEKKFETFLDHYALTALRGESMEMSGLTRLQLNRLLTDPVKKEAFDMAEEDATHAMADEATHRATKGQLVPIFDRNGKRSGTVRKKSDLLLIFLLKARNPAKYRDTYTYQEPQTNELDYDNPRERIASRITGIRSKLRGDNLVIDAERVPDPGD